jgi:predicted MPP superfamily phosphohydrolase
MRVETLEQAGVGIVKFQLETEPEDFNQVRAQFIEDLAVALSVNPEAIWITHIRPGCTILVVLVPLEARKKLLAESTSGEKSLQTQELEQAYSISRTEFEDRIVGPYPSTDLPVPQHGRMLTWLHLSDLHLRGQKSAKQWLQDQVTEELLNDLPNLLSDRGLRPDLVFFTGDVAFSAQESEYKTAKGFLSKLVTKLPIKPKFFFVPGNHDVEWDKVDSKDDRKLRQKLGSDESVVQYLVEDVDSNKGGWDKHLQRFENFFKFTRAVSEFGQPRMNNGYFYTVEMKHLGVRLGIAGLNSAWLSTSKKSAKKGGMDLDLGNLTLGRPQVVTALQQLESAQIKFALFHHPLASEWFKPFDALMQKNKLTEFDFILSGHEHKAEAIGRDLGFERTLYHLAAGALYEHSEYPNSFNAATIDLDKGLFTIFYWSYQQNRGKWDIDTSVEFTRSGRIEFLLRSALRKRLRKVLDPPEEADLQAMAARAPKNINR